MIRVRGSGGVYRRGSVWWIRYSRNGHLIRESAETPDEKKAIRFLNQRIEEAKRPAFVGPGEKRLTLDDLEAAIKADYIRHNRRSWITVEYCLKQVRKYFPHDTLLQLGARIEEYQDHRLEECKAERSTINRESAYLRRGYRLLHEAKKISEVPVIKLLEGENVREGFINSPEFHAALAEIKNDDVRDTVEFLYKSAWRSGEAKSLEWSKVDAQDWVIRLSRKNEKTKRPRVLALIDDLRAIIERRIAKRIPGCKFVFHREGRPIGRIDIIFKAACAAVGLDGVVPHDMRRSAIRNFTKAGLDESVGMSISGHVTNSIYKRYNIIDEELQRAALEKVQAYQRTETERKVVPLKRAG
jgi:integrase